MTWRIIIKVKIRIWESCDSVFGNSRVFLPHTPHWKGYGTQYLYSRACGIFMGLLTQTFGLCMLIFREEIEFRWATESGLTQFIVGFFHHRSSSFITPSWLMLVMVVLKLGKVLHFEYWKLDSE